MRRVTACCLLMLMMALAPGAAPAQNLTGRTRSARGFKQYVTNGKLRLTMADAVRLMLLNNSDVRIEQQSVEQARDAVVRSLAPFDPLLSSAFSTNRQTTPTFSQLSGAPTLSDLEQNTQVGFQKTFSTGTEFQSNFQSSRTSTNSIYNFFNPSLTSRLNFSINQPLLRNRGRFVNRASIMIARRNLEQSEAQFRQQIDDAIERVVQQYWRVVLDRENMQVLTQSYKAAQASYNHDRRALQLGALSPLDIYQSESEVATRKVAVIRAQYALKQDEDQLRMTLGADLDPVYSMLDLDLKEPPKPNEPLLTVNTEKAIAEALAKRPNLAALNHQLEANNIGIRLSHNQLKPDLELSAQYSSNGLGGNEYSSTGTRALIASGGLGDALGQVFGFGYPAYGVTLQLNLPIKNHAAEANLADARVRRVETLYQIRRTKEQVRLEVKDATNELDQAKLSIAAARTARDLAEKNVEAQQRKYQLGSGLIFLVLQAQTQLAQAEQSLVLAQVNYRLAVVAIEHATGTLLDRYHVQVTQAVP